MSRRRTSAGSIFWGLTLVAIGGLLLARNMGYAIPIWGPLVRYWPVLIIGWGILKLVDYYRLRNEPDHRPIFTGGEVAMLIFAIFLGSAMTAAANISPDVGRFFNFDSDFDFWDMTGSTYTYNEHHELPIKAGSTIRIFNLYGTVTVSASDNDNIVLDVEKIVRAANKEEADQRSQDFTFSIQDAGGTYRIASNRDQDFFGQADTRIGNDRQRFKSNLTIHVPKKAALDLSDRYGAVTVTGLEGDQTITNRYGPTSLHDITGALTLNTGYGSVVVENVSGPTKVTNRYASTTVRKIGGNADVDNEYGSVDVQDVKGDTSIHNRYSVVNVQRVGGGLRIQGNNNSIDIDDAAGYVDVQTSYKNVSIRNAKGDLKASNRHGGIDIEFDDAPTHEVRVDGSYTDVTLELPTNAKFSLDARTSYGDIDSEFDSVNVNSSGRERSARGEQGTGGPRMVIETQHGTVRIEKRG